MLFNKRLYIFFLFCFGLFLTSKATHNRAGEITYKWLFGTTYEIKVTTYTNIGSQGLADRCQDTVYFGDGTSAVVSRTNGVLGGCAPAREGVPISTNIKLNEYVTHHTFPGPGSYHISMEDPNRNADVINIPNSVNQVFYIESLLVIPTFSTGKNDSPVLSIPPIDKGCVNNCFTHNPGAYDVDGDSISYQLTFCRGHNGAMCPGYTFPETGPGGIYNVNAITGTLTWCSPQMQGEYNLAMIIKEWRKDDDGEYFLIGYIIRDLQVDVTTCLNNPPHIKPITDTCVVAGSIITKTITATDSDPDLLTLTANGGPFGVTNPTATFASSPSTGTVQGVFNWQTTCAHIRKSSYQVTIKVKDQDQGALPLVDLVDFKTFNITVIAPPPLNVVATPQGTNIKVTWNPPICNPTTGNKIIHYRIYRRMGCVPWIPAVCETGVPTSSGYTYIGASVTTSYIDTNGGNGLSQGTSYSYIVVAVFTDGAQSYASNNSCAQLKRDIPILVNVDVKTTDPSTGSVFIRWIKPLTGINALDTQAVPGPYKFRLLHHNGFSGTFTPIDSVTKPSFYLLNQLSDTTYIHTGINTQDFAHTYKIELYANGDFIGAGQKASSVFLTATPSDNKIKLTWQHQVPWTNSKYRIYKKSPVQIVYSVIDSTSLLTYTDTGLVNGVLYCYKVEAVGAYADPTIFSPLINFSEEVCSKPVDLTPPCSPTLELIFDCQIPSLVMQWNNPNHVCSDDAVKYNLYFAKTEDEDLALVDSIKNMNDTIYTFDDLTSIAGCWAVTAVDSFGNESLQSIKMCADNCPEYELPNVITINGDSINDFFKPIKNKFIRDIDLKIYNRWGNLVFETTDPKIMWDGKVLQSKLLSTEGTYFYVCQVNEIRVTGIKERYLKGFIQIFHQ